MGGKSKRKGLILGTVGAAVIMAAIPALIRRRDHKRGGEYDRGCGSLPNGSEKEGVVSQDGTRIWVDYIGEDGPTVFFVHGYSTKGTVFHYQKDYFKDKYRVVTMDHRGHGRSEMPRSKDLSIDRLAEDLKAVIDAFKPEEFVIAGHSMGGFTTFKFHEKFGDEYEGRLKGLAILDSSGIKLSEGMKLGGLFDLFYPLTTKYILLAGGLGLPFAEKIKDLLGRSSLGYVIVRLLVYGKKGPATEVEFQREITFSSSLPTLSLGAKACWEYCCRHHLEHMDLPVLMLAGSADNLINAGLSKRTYKMLPNARWEVLEGSGHNTMLDNTKQFNQVLEGFLQECLSG